MALDNGIYIIACKANNSYVGRFPVEDLSLMPKQVFALPQGMQTPHVCSSSLGPAGINRPFES